MDEKQIEGVIPTTLKQALFKKGGVQTTVQCTGKFRLFFCTDYIECKNRKICKT